MPQVFISYSGKDSAMAQKLYLALKMAGAEPFLAELDLHPGVVWKAEILNALRSAPWVFFLATPNSCPSQAVAHEIGAGLVLNKKLIPLMSGVQPKDLPPWVDDRHAIDLADGTRAVVTTALICFVLWVLSRE
jgi:hypothetical protein